MIGFRSDSVSCQALFSHKAEQDTKWPYETKKRERNYFNLFLMQSTHVQWHNLLMQSLRSRQLSIKETF